MANTSWKDTVKRYCDEWREYARDVRDGSIPPGATDEELWALRNAFDARGLHLDPDATSLLRIVNGTSFDGQHFFGAAINDDNDPYHRIDIVRFNDEYNDNPSRYTLYGTSSMDL